MRHTIVWIISPTYIFARWLKQRGDRKTIIEDLNQLNFLLAFILGGAATFFPSIISYFIATKLLIGYYCISRCSEILIAFILDAFAKLNGEKSLSKLRPGDRVRLAIKSYIELILNFGMIYWLLPCSFFGGTGIANYVQGVYFSGITITTLGYGEIHPIHWLPQILTIYEVLTGFTLIVVSFTVYTGLGKEKS